MDGSRKTASGYLDHTSGHEFDDYDYHHYLTALHDHHLDYVDDQTGVDDYDYRIPRDHSYDCASRHVRAGFQRCAHHRLVL
jgi:hypothetical protein